MKVSERAPKEMFWVEWTTAQRETRDSLSAKSPASSFLLRCSKRRRRANRVAHGSAVGDKEKTTDRQPRGTSSQPKTYRGSYLICCFSRSAMYSCSYVILRRRASRLPM